MNIHTTTSARVLKRYRLLEAQIGEAMRNRARDEGHRPQFPSKMSMAQTGGDGIITEAVFAALAHANTSPEICEITGLMKDQVRSALSSLKRRGRVESQGNTTGRPHVWSRT